MPPDKMMSPDAFNPFALSSVSVLSALSPQNPHPGRSFPLLSVLALELPPPVVIVTVALVMRRIVSA